MFAPSGVLEPLGKGLALLLLTGAACLGEGLQPSPDAPLLPLKGLRLPCFSRVDSGGVAGLGGLAVAGVVLKLVPVERQFPLFLPRCIDQVGMNAPELAINVGGGLRSDFVGHAVKG